MFASCRNCVFTTSVWSKTIAVLTELRFADWLQHLQDTLLYQPVPDTGDSQRSGCSVRFWNVFASYWFRAVSMWCSCNDISDFSNNLVRL